MRRLKAKSKLEKCKYKRCSYKRVTGTKYCEKHTHILVLPNGSIIKFPPIGGTDRSTYTSIPSHDGTLTLTKMTEIYEAARREDKPSFLQRIKAFIFQ